MYRSTMALNHGMVFIYTEDTVVPIWMKNTYLPLDILWIDKNLSIIDAQEGIPLSEKILYPLGPARFVIEINHGQLKKSKAKLGDKIQLL